MEAKYCQACAMPMGEIDALYGTETDGSKSCDYCSYCYENGKNTFNGTMDEMMEVCLPYMLKANVGMSEKEAKKIMADFFPKLKRWQ